MSVLVIAPERPNEDWYVSLHSLIGRSRIHIVDDYAQESVRLFARKNKILYFGHKRVSGPYEAFKTGLRSIQDDEFEWLLIHEGGKASEKVFLSKEDIVSKLRALETSRSIESPDALLSFIQFSTDWDAPKPECFDLLFFPMSAYHAWTISLLAPKLEEANIRYNVVDLSIHRDDFGLASAIQKHSLAKMSLSDFILFQPQVRAIVAFNDWDPTIRPTLNLANKLGIGTIGIVEGIQDYWDVDTARDRFAYRTVKNLCFSGIFDKKYFVEHMPNHCVLGVPRVIEMRNNQPSRISNNINPKALINSNFSYDVLVEHRDRWLKEAVETAQVAGYEPVISRHPGDKGELFPELVSRKGFYENLAVADVTIQRFASGILEALAWNVPVVYYNPSVEKVDKFLDSLGAYQIATSKSELLESLKNPYFDKIAAGKFLDFHAGSADLNTGQVFAEFTSSICKMVQVNTIDWARFYTGMKKLDKLSDLYIFRLPIFSRYDIDLETIEISKSYLISRKLGAIVKRTPLRNLLSSSFQKKLKNILYRL